MHYVTADEIRAYRAATLDTAYAADPTRFRRRPVRPTARIRVDQPTQQGGPHPNN